MSVEVLQACCEANAAALKRCRGLLHSEACATVLVSFFCQPDSSRQLQGCLVHRVRSLLALVWPDPASLSVAASAPADL